MQNIELQHIQRLVIQGYSHLPCAAYLLLRVEAGAAERARRWLAERIARVGTGLAEERVRERELSSAARALAEPQKASGESLLKSAIAFTYEGLGALGLPVEREDVSAGFLAEFRSGITGEPYRVRSLGDVGDSAPDHWRWGSRAQPVHILWMLFALDEATREEWLQRELAALDGLELVDQPIRCAFAADSTEPFGFRDGISQPLIAGSGTSRSAAAVDADAIRAGEFVLGYRNQFDHLPVSPMLPATLDPEGVLPKTGLDVSKMRDFGRNGSYLVARQLAQDVEGFAHAGEVLAREHPELGSPRDVQARLVGRRQDGTPLAPRPRGTRISPTENAFEYWHADRYGYRCPIGSHIRRSNPRDALARPVLGVSPERARELADHHRIVRRGRPYQREDGERGLMFLCLQANIERQFEFVQRNWLRNERFGGLAGERDPIAAGPTPTNGAAASDRTERSRPERDRPERRGAASSGPGSPFSVQHPFVDRRLDGLANYVTVKGGGYFFLPSLPALRYLASLG